ncbi:phosphatase [Amylibacter marinus]|uniref:phosphoglycolate phosphatase n=1 Tax=Amylibacter marinus TaxID=1475483 RepID=A0ABQ5VTP9_9RHOB|nr:HAD family hydrolase [Amylibacter marinus]GLQ34646.1 phosphatase [Amylibacter marinus]
MATIKALLFDKDGTLIDFEASWAPGMGAFLKHLVPNDSEIRSALGLACGFDTARGCFLAGSSFVNGTIDDTLACMQAAYPALDVDLFYSAGAACFEDLEPAPICDLNQVLGDLKSRGYILGVITNASEKSAEQQLEKLAIRGLFSSVIGYDSGHAPKPAPDTILGFCQAFNLHPSEVAMIGDSTHDLDAGYHAKVGKNIAVLSGPASRADLGHRADLILDDIRGLSAVLR